MTDQDAIIIRAMQKWGGSFVQRLSAAFIAADSENKGKLKNAFEAEFNKYLAMAEAAGDDIYE